MSTRKIWFFNLLFLCLLNLSCSLSELNNSNISFNLPVSRSASDDLIIYNVKLTDMNGGIYFNEKIKGQSVYIGNLPAGTYYLVVDGKDSTYRYFGDKHLTVKPRKNTDVIIKLIKTNLNPNQDNSTSDENNRVLESITVTLKENEYLTYGAKSIDIKKFNIVENYSNGDKVTITNNDYKKYSIQGGSTNTLGNIKVTIKNYDNPKIKQESYIPCKFVLATPKVTLDHDNITATQNSSATITANVSFSPTMEKEWYDITYEWLQKNSEGNYSVIKSQNGKSFNPPTNKQGNTTYKCKVTVKPKQKYKEFCVGSSKESSSKDITVEVTN